MSEVNIIEHLEKHLGEISRGWGDGASSTGIQIVSFENQPFQDIVTYSTLGLINTVLPMNISKVIRQELLFLAYRNFDCNRIASFLYTFAEYLLSTNKALLRCDFIGPEASIIPGSLLNSVYVSRPVIYDNTLTIFNSTI